MKREELIKLAQSFLGTYGYISKSTSINNAILFSRPTGMGITDELLVYFHEKGEERNLGKTLLDLDAKYSRIVAGEEGRRLFLSNEPIGIVPQEITKAGFTYQVPVYFFDREFQSGKKTTPLSQLEEEAAKFRKERIEQPYKTGSVECDEDLLDVLISELENSKDPCLRIIVAPAGYGKTVLMGTLYTVLRDKFLGNKQKQKIGRRPLLMLPGHLRKASDLDSLVNNFIGDEYDYGVSNKDAFNFWLKNNFTIWLLDGLEELILRIPEEFIYTILHNYIYASDSIAPQIVIAIRKPVLATSPELREPIEEWEGSGVRVYELCDWEGKQIKRYFQKNLKLEQAEVDNFLMDISTSASLRNICSVPYYCRLVADLKNNRQMAVFNDDCELLEHAINKLCEREFSKGLDRDIVSISTQRDLFTDVARESYKGNKISKLQIMEIADYYLSEIAEDVKRNQIECLLRHAFLTQLGEDIDFLHEIIKQHLIGLSLSQDLKNNRTDIFENQEIEVDSLIAKNLIKNSHLINWKQVTEKSSMMPSSEHDEAIGFRNIFKILLQTHIEEKESLIKDYLQNRNLAGLMFKNLNMEGFQFQKSDLTNVEFLNCKLKNVNFNNCYFKNTSFDSLSDLTGATTKGATFVFIRVGTRPVDDQKRISEYFYERTQVPTEYKGPCQAVINLTRILEKLVKRGKGYEIPKKFIIQTKCGGGIPASECLENCIKDDLISETGERVKIKLKFFEDVEQFVQSRKANRSIRKILDSICKDVKSGCEHIYD
jgi:hypothetical protein